VQEAVAIQECIDSLRKLIANGTLTAGKPEGKKVRTPYRKPEAPPPQVASQRAQGIEQLVTRSNGPPSAPKPAPFYAKAAAAFQNGAETLTVKEIASRAGLTIQQAYNALSDATLKRLVERAEDGKYRRYRK
jgi:predicted Rossmann fold nucleotide-binding protein DprA/Smf involved in DNA uptake